MKSWLVIFFLLILLSSCKKNNDDEPSTSPVAYQLISGWGDTLFVHLEYRDDSNGTHQEFFNLEPGQTITIFSREIEDSKLANFTCSDFIDSLFITNDKVNVMLGEDPLSPDFWDALVGMPEDDPGHVCLRTIDSSTLRICDYAGDYLCRKVAQSWYYVDDTTFYWADTLLETFKVSKGVLPNEVILHCWDSGIFHVLVKSDNTFFATNAPPNIGTWSTGGEFFPPDSLVVNFYSWIDQQYYREIAYRGKR